MEMIKKIKKITWVQILAFAIIWASMDSQFRNSGIIPHQIFGPMASLSFVFLPFSILYRIMHKSTRSVKTVTQNTFNLKTQASNTDESAIKSIFGTFILIGGFLIVGYLLIFLVPFLNQASPATALFIFFLFALVAGYLLYYQLKKNKK